MIARLTAALSDRYRIERELGAGGMATVYLAQDVRHDRKVAIKVLKPELAAVLGADRFVVEIKTTASLSHPHILPLFDSGTAEGFLFYVMPYIQGETIREKLNRETQFGVDEAVRITREVADALDYAHRHGVIHRDIKPENILLHDGRAMVMDFGIALAVSAAAGGRMTETGLSLGTPHYMSPEQATAEKELTARSDIYSLGSVLYEMLAGQPPHLGGSAQQVIMKIVTDTARPVSELRKSVPPNVAAAVAKSLEKLSADRFESAKAFADALGDARFTIATTAATAPPVRTTIRLLPWGIAAALAIALVAALVTRRSVPTQTSRPMTFQLEGSSDSAVAGSVAISADGKDIVFSAGRRGQSMLYHRALAVPGVRPIPGTEGAGIGIVLPDRSVIYWKDRELRQVGLDGGAPVRFARIGSSPAGMTWSAHTGLVLGMLLFSTPRGLSRVARGDTAVTAITELPKGGMHHDPVMLPGGEHAAFTSIRDGNKIGVALLKDGSWEAYEVSATPGRMIGYADGFLVYLSARKLMAIPWDERRQRPAGDPMPIPDVPEGVADAALALDGTLVVLTAARRVYEIVLADPRGNLTPLRPGETIPPRFIPRFGPGGSRVAFRILVNGVSDGILGVDDRVFQPLRFEDQSAMLSIAWTRDGRVFTGSQPFSLRGEQRPKAVLRAQPADGSDTARAVVQFDQARVSGFDVSADGRFVALVTNPFGAGEGAAGDILLVRADSAGQPRPLVAGPADETAPRFSPDGRWLAYASDESGSYQVYVRSLSSSANLQVSVGGGGQPVWSTDGKRLLYRSGSSIMAADLAETSTGGLSIRGQQRVLEGDFLGRESDRVATYDVDSRGRLILARALPGDTAPIMVRTGWIPALKAQMAARPPKAEP